MDIDAYQEEKDEEEEPEEEETPEEEEQEEEQPDEDEAPAVPQVRLSNVSRMGHSQESIQTRAARTVAVTESRSLAPRGESSPDAASADTLVLHSTREFQSLPFSRAIFRLLLVHSYLPGVHVRH